MLLKDHLRGVDPGLQKVLLAVAQGGRKVAEGFRDRQGVAGTKNVYGETQVEMDKWADTVFADVFQATGEVSTLASEERPDLTPLSSTGSFSVTIDPLDGSSLMGVNLTVGTIVGVHRSTSPLRKGRELAAAAYVLYGPLTVMAYTVGAGVHEFVMGPEGDFVMQRENLVIGKERLYSPGALRRQYLPYHLRFIEKLEERGYKLRFAGSFVADVHQILHKGGVFTYPAYEGKREGKLRLLFEAQPMGFIVRNAGGAASDGRGDILDIQPDGLHQRTPIYIGGKDEIALIQEEIGKEA